MPHRKSIFLIALLSSALVTVTAVDTTAGFAFGAGQAADERSSAALAGIQTVGLAVSTKLSDPSLNSKLQDQLRSIAQKRLASCGILITPADAAESAGKPILTIVIAPEQVARNNYIEAALNLLDLVRSPRAQDQYIRLQTWAKKADFPSSPDNDDITNHVTSLLDSFMADYLVANPRLPGSNPTQNANSTTPALRGMTPTVVQQDNAPSLSGSWDSTYGTVTLHQGDRDSKGLILVSGYWVEANAGKRGEKWGKRGEIQVGRFDPKTETLTFSFYEPWQDSHGKAVLKLSSDGQTLDGTRRLGMHKWKWTMWR